MSLAFAIQKAAPYYQNQQAIQSLLGGGDPFSSIPGFNATPGSSADVGGTGHSASTDAVLQQVMDKLRSTSDSSPLAVSPTASAATPAGPVPIYTPPAYSNPFTGMDLPGGGGKDLDSLLHNSYNNSNFNHYASPNKDLPFVGPNYEKYGAMNGYVYDPYTDRYKTNENTLLATDKAQGGVTNAAKIAQEFGLAPQTPSFGSTLLNGVLGVLGTGAAGALSGSLFGKGASGGGLLGSLLGGGGSGATGSGDIFGIGSSGPDFASLLGDSGAGADAPLTLPILGTLLAGQAGSNMLNGTTDNSPMGDAGRLQLGLATGGLSEAANKIKHLF